MLAHTNMTESQLKWREERRVRLARLNGAKLEKPTAQDACAQSVPAPPVQPQAAAPRLGLTPDERFSLSGFVSSRTSTLAFAAALSIATSDRSDRAQFNPLYIHGPGGVGKSHLVHGLAAEAVALSPILLDADQFGRISVSRDLKAVFLNQLSDCFLLIIDNVQYLRSQMPQELLHLCIDKMRGRGRQIVVTADVSSGELERYGATLAQALGSGLQIEIGIPDVEARKDIILSKLERARQKYPTLCFESGVTEFTADNLKSGRDLDSAINRFVAKAVLLREPVTLGWAKLAISDLVRPGDIRRVRIEDIQRIVARHYNVSKADILSARRTANVVRPRQIAMYMAKVMTLRSLPEIGRRFGGRDHTTVLHAVRKIEALCSNSKDALLREEINSLQRQVMEA